MVSKNEHTLTIYPLQHFSRKKLTSVVKTFYEKSWLDISFQTVHMKIKRNSPWGASNSKKVVHEQRFSKKMILNTRDFEEKSLNWKLPERS